MSGYCGYSMSNNAVDAYNNGEKPLSKWKKADILSALEDLEYQYMDMVAKLKVSELKEHFLYQSSWHHTSKHYNKTYFYAIDEDAMETITEEKIIEIIANRTENIKNAEVEKRGRITVNVWGGSRRHPKIIGTDTQEGIVKGDWLIYDGGKYKISANKTISFEYLN